MLNVTDLHLAYAQQQVLRGVSFDLQQGQIGCLLGPSGCGKSSLLRAIAGFETPQSGDIAILQRSLKQQGRWLPTEQRDIGMVFQDYALFPHLTIAENIGYGLHKRSKAERNSRVQELLSLVNLSAWATHYPHELSGGQQQRVALARALAPNPQLLLMDEPFSNLDVELKESLSIECRRIIQQAGITALLVTHDQYEAFAMTDVIGVLHEGRIEQWDSAYRLYHEPQTAFVADFVGSGVLVKGQIQAAGQVYIDGLGQLPLHPARLQQPFSLMQQVQVLLRPDDVIHDDASQLQAKVLARVFRGAEFFYRLALANGLELMAVVPSHHEHAIGEWIGIRLEVEHVVVFEPNASLAGYHQKL